MRYKNVYLQSIGYQLPYEILYTDDLERDLESVYKKLHIPSGQIAALTGVRERRIWPKDMPVWKGAAQAAQKALNKGRLSSNDIGMLCFCGVCRDAMEPATACAIAHELGIRGKAEVLDLSNACLGMLNGLLHAANAIELGQIQAALIVSCESSRRIIDLTIERMKQNPTMHIFKQSLATMTGGSGAVAIVVTSREPSLSNSSHKLLGGVSHTAPEWHELCKWGHVPQDDGTFRMIMETDAPAVLQNGIGLGKATWENFLKEMGWLPSNVDKMICHQVGEGHRAAIFKNISMPVDKDFSTFEFLGNIGTVSLPITAAIAEERGFLKTGDNVAFLGIGSGLNCMMLGLEW